jgi:uncharacterized protein
MVDLRPLKGARIWLAGSLSGEADSAALANFQAFVREFGARVFAQDGTIVHGSHPSMVPLLLEAAAAHQKNEGRRDALLLAGLEIPSREIQGRTHALGHARDRA